MGPVQTVKRFSEVTSQTERDRRSGKSTSSPSPVILTKNSRKQISNAISPTPGGTTGVNSIAKDCDNFQDCLIGIASGFVGVIVRTGTGAWNSTAGYANGSGSGSANAKLGIMTLFSVIFVLISMLKPSMRYIT